MCYHLYGVVNKEINIDDFDRITKDTNYHFLTGTEEEIIKSINAEDCKYRITREYCDCGTPIGDGHKNKSGLKEAADYLRLLQDIRGIKYAYLCKVWTGDRVEKEQTVHIQDIDLLYFLANTEDCCLYKIELYKKYW